jgi:hypothetical protein
MFIILEIILHNISFVKIIIGQAHPWVVPLGTSHLDFLGTIKR